MSPQGLQLQLQFLRPATACSLAVQVVVLLRSWLRRFSSPKGRENAVCSLEGSKQITRCNPPTKCHQPQQRAAAGGGDSARGLNGMNG